MNIYQFFEKICFGENGFPVSLTEINEFINSHKNNLSSLKHDAVIFESKTIAEMYNKPCPICEHRQKLRDEGKDDEDAGPCLRLHVTTADSDTGASHARPTGCTSWGVDSSNRPCAAKPSHDEPDALIAHVRIRGSPGRETALGHPATFFSPERLGNCRVGVAGASAV